MMFKLQLISLFLLLGSTTGLRLPHLISSESAYKGPKSNWNDPWDQGIMQDWKHVGGIWDGSGIDLVWNPRPSRSLKEAINDEFESMVQLEASPWYTYMNSIYVSSQMKFPLRISDLWCIQLDLLPPDLRAIFQQASSTPTALYDAYWQEDPHVDEEKKSIVYIYQYSRLPDQFKGIEKPPADPNKAEKTPDIDDRFPLLNGLPSNAWVEIERGREPREFSPWLYYMPGTGNWMNLGKTIAFPTHQQALQHFEVDSKIWFTDNGYVAYEELAKRAHSQGFDTVQFTSHPENFFKFELLVTKYQEWNRQSPCIPGIVTRDKKPCICVDDRQDLTCMVGSKWLPALPYAPPPKNATYSATESGAWPSLGAPWTALLVCMFWAL